MKFRILISFISLTAVLTAGKARAGGSGLNVIVVVNQNSTNSVQLGNDYCELRGVPPQNLLRITNWTGGNINWSPADFETFLHNPLLSLVAGRGLTNQAQMVLLSMDIPYRVTDGNNVNSTTAALFYGFKTNGAPVEGIASCSLPDNSSNSYAYSEMPFRLSPPNTAATNSFLAMMLTDTNFSLAENIMRRGVASDSSYPTQTVYLEKTSDWARNVRFTEFDNAVFENQVAGNFAVTRLDSSAYAFTNLFGFLTGLWSFSFATNAFVPGGLGDTLTSYGGYILENSGQTSALAFLEAGAAGSFGTVVEPCNYTQKFPDAVDYFYQTRGFSLAEAYYQSVLNPFQGLMVGEPLAAPFARPGIAAWTSLTNGSALSGLAMLSLNFNAASTNLPLAQADLFVDGTYFHTMTNMPPAAGNMLTVTLNASPINYTVPADATIGRVATELANALNLQSNLTQVAAFPFGDRIELQSLAVTTPGSNVTASASAAVGAASSLTARVTAARATFLDSIAAGYQIVTIYNAPIVGDWLQFTFIKTNGSIVTIGVTNNTAGATIGALAQNLVNQINANAALQSADGLLAADFFDADPYGQAAVQFFLYARSPGWPASQILAMLTTSATFSATPVGTNPLADNVGDLRPRNHLYVSSGLSLLPVNFALDTTPLADGYHQLTAVAYEGTSVATQTRVTRNVRILNTGLSATLTALPAATNIALGQNLQFTVAASPTNVTRIELFGAGGSLALATNQATAAFVVPSASLGLGLLPFYALVTDQAGHRYQTQTVWYRVIGSATLTLTGTPPTLDWPAIPGRVYEVQSATNLTTSFQTLATMVATNAILHWPLTTTGRAGFYRVKLNP